MAESKAVVILNHGSRNRLACVDFLDFVEAIKRRQPDFIIERASMGLSEPDLKSVISRLYGGGIRHITVIPFFLFRGMHIVKDIPEMVEEIKNAHPGLEIKLGNVLLPDDRLEDIVIQRIMEAMK